MGYLFNELKRRNVFRVGAGYVVISWLIVQVIETVSEPLHLPEWTEAFFIVLLLAGLPLIVMFAWVFEITPEGMKRTRDVDRTESVTASTGRILDFAIIGTLVLALAYFIWERQGLVEQAATNSTAAVSAGESATAAAASIAVLPFVNMSADADKEYFSDGISEELLNLLAKIPELQVAARTSSFQFKGRNLDIAEVAEQLNVAHVLEGSVRTSGVRVRITAQLIKADSGFHLWSETYDRELDDIFAIQDEISAAIVTALSDALGLKTKAAPQVRAAASTDAYNSFLLGQHLLTQRNKQDIESAIPNFERALELDPAYAPAHASLGLAWYLLTASRQTYGTLTLEESLANGLPHIEQALQLDPELAEAHGAMGLLLDARERYEEAAAYYEEALRLNPSLTDVRNWYSSNLESVGRIRDAYEEMEKAYRLDPLSILTLNNYTNELLRREKFDELGPVLERLALVDPGRGSAFKAFVKYRQQQAGEGLILQFRAIDLDPGSLRLRGQAAYSLSAMGLQDEALAIWPNADNTLPIVANDTDAAYTLELARSQYDKDPNDPANLEALAWAYWDSGNSAEAKKIAERYLNSLGAVRRPLSDINEILLLDAWEQGDETAMMVRLRPLEAYVDAYIADGVRGFFTDRQKAIYAYLRGDPDTALRHLSLALERTIYTPATFAFEFDRLGWNELPEFARLRRAHEEYKRAERLKFLGVACGPDGFTVWRPSPDTCAVIEGI